MTTKSKIAEPMSLAIAVERLSEIAELPLDTYVDALPDENQDALSANVNRLPAGVSPEDAEVFGRETFLFVLQYLTNSYHHASSSIINLPKTILLQFRNVSIFKNNFELI